MQNSERAELWNRYITSAVGSGGQAKRDKVPVEEV